MTRRHGLPPEAILRAGQDPTRARRTACAVDALLRQSTLRTSDRTVFALRDRLVMSGAWTGLAMSHATVLSPAARGDSGPTIRGPLGYPTLLGPITMSRCRRSEPVMPPSVTQRPRRRGRTLTVTSDRHSSPQCAISTSPEAPRSRASCSIERITQSMGMRARSGTGPYSPLST